MKMISHISSIYFCCIGIASGVDPGHNPPLQPLCLHVESDVWEDKGVTRDGSTGQLRVSIQDRASGKDIGYAIYIPFFDTDHLRPIGEGQKYDYLLNKAKDVCSYTVQHATKNYSCHCIKLNSNGSIVFYRDINDQIAPQLRKQLKIGQGDERQLSIGELDGNKVEMDGYSYAQRKTMVVWVELVADGSVRLLKSEFTKE